MAEAFVNVSEGSGKKLHAFDRTIGANTVLDEATLNGEPYVASYSLNVSSAGTSIATAADHVLCLNAGATLNVFVRRILVYQTVLVTTAALARFELFKTTTAAPTGGGAVTAQRMDNADAAAGATGMTLPTVKAVEGARMWSGAYGLTQTAPTAGFSALMFDINFDQLKHKSLIIPAGTTNGIAFKNIAAQAGATISVVILFSEANFL